MSMSPRQQVDPVGDRAEADRGLASPSRRRFVRNVGLGAAAVGVAATAGATLTGVAAAQDATKELDPSDVALLQFFQSLSLAGNEGLAAAADHPELGSRAAELLRQFSRHHDTQAHVFGDLLTEAEADEITTANPTLLAELGDAVNGASDEAGVLGAVYRFEEQMTATALEGMAQASNWEVAGAVAVVLPVLGQQAAALGAAAGNPISEWMPAFGTTEGAFPQDAYPVQ